MCMYFQAAILSARSTFIYIDISMFVHMYTYIYIYMHMLTLPIDPRDLPLFESTAVEVLSVQHQPSTFVDADIRENRVLLKARHLCS